MTLLDDLLQSKNSTKYESSYEKPSPKSPSSPLISKGINSGEGKTERVAALDTECNPSGKFMGSGCNATKADAARWRQDVTPNSRFPIVPPAVRANIESIEGDARAKGWPPELLWNAEFWGSPRGLAALLDEVTLSPKSQLTTSPFSRWSEPFSGFNGEHRNHCREDSMGTG